MASGSCRPTPQRRTVLVIVVIVVDLPFLPPSFPPSLARSLPPSLGSQRVLCCSLRWARFLPSFLRSCGCPDCLLLPRLALGPLALVPLKREKFNSQNRRRFGAVAVAASAISSSAFRLPTISQQSSSSPPPPPLLFLPDLRGLLPPPSRK